MSFAEFEQSVRVKKTPPPGLSPALQALWHEAKGYWYARAGRKFPDISLETEWSEIARELLLKTADEC